MKATVTFLILAVTALALGLVVKNHGQNPLTQPVVRVSIVNGQCLSVLVIESNTEVEKGCEEYARLKIEGKPYILRKVPPEDWSRRDRAGIG
ncbi:MAG: hypothetical protein COW88_03600 [Candidatus Lloydbacteria bacterium CG22_combo_CG10-13_8_21_14_all_47_15]|uniref:Uncharacterized protein n=1 Tax=Candidatus Lloydbacteria bacterium CG22_combo_CG10-13_8_21_14_all_47_15 TaxID=1974635 RepID=A0A2H0CUA5_9BACT|nr:MAG: hypothetical protein COW88_03600 [Candidatus Lloydbacteria bacterium CG22_combo_CG10-13_8_21_14_all_47_15]